MPQVLIRNLDAETVARLKALAKEHRRSLQAEARVILERAVARREGDWRKGLAKLDRMFAGRRLRDSTPLIREAREGR